MYDRDPNLNSDLDLNLSQLILKPDLRSRPYLIQSRLKSGPIDTYTWLRPRLNVTFDQDLNLYQTIPLPGPRPRNNLKPDLDLNLNQLIPKPDPNQDLTWSIWYLHLNQPIAIPDPQTKFNLSSNWDLILNQSLPKPDTRPRCDLTLDHDCNPKQRMLKLDPTVT